MVGTDMAGGAGVKAGGVSGLLRTNRTERAPRPAQWIEPDERPTILVAGPPERAGELANWASRAGWRNIGTVDLAAVGPRLAQTVAVDLILADLRGGALNIATGSALAHRHGLLDARLAVITDLAGVDAAFAQLGPDTEIVCDPKPSDIIGLLVMAALDGRRRRCDPQLHDAARADDDTRIEQLSEEVRRLATTIDRLTQQNGAVMNGATHLRPTGIDGTAYKALGEPGEERPENIVLARGGAETTNAVTHAEIRAFLRARRLREQYLPADLFADPAWDMILDLMAARLAGQRVSVSSLCIAASVPPTTALRWIRQLTERGVFLRIDDPVDGRRVFIELTDEAANAFMAWAQTVRRGGGLFPLASPR